VSDLTEKTTLEWCSYCEMEVEIAADNATKCPNCGESIFPCSTCDDLPKRCDWKKDYGCWRFPQQEMQAQPISAHWNNDGQVVLAVEVTLPQETISKPEAKAIALDVGKNLLEQLAKAGTVIESARQACEELEGHRLYAITTLRQAIAQYDRG
jgi:predicted RNA-binding Zn-ribbon protein involved in translation (DUF1610 family)